MTQTLLIVVGFIALLACVPVLLKWLQARTPGLGGCVAGADSRVVSAVAVGPSQRVVTVEVGPPESRAWLVLGVTGQNITCLHVVPRSPAPLPPERIEASV